MPMITVDVAAAPDVKLTKKIVERITELSSGILGKDPRVTAIAVDYLPPRQWFVGGRSVEEIGKAAFFLDVRISDGTNTKDEKARFVAEAFKAMERLLGAVHPESYIHVDDARADAYGYGGLTQERRYVQGRPAPEPRG
ncbi:MAG: tautomerase family protein [Myxococcales bacterium]